MRFVAKLMQKIQNLKTTRSTCSLISYTKPKVLYGILALLIFVFCSSSHRNPIEFWNSKEEFILIWLKILAFEMTTLWTAKYLRFWYFQEILLKKEKTKKKLANDSISQFMIWYSIYIYVLHILYTI